MVTIKIGLSIFLHCVFIFFAPVSIFRSLFLLIKQAVSKKNKIKIIKNSKV